ncbi:MAG: hypothetical protein ABI867_17045 [Kofleriaceae bacterium]
MSKRIALALCLLAGCSKSNDAPKSEPASTTSPTPTEQPKPESGSGESRRNISKFDTDHDGKVSQDERAAGRHKRTAALRDRLDKNKDGKLTVEEVAGADARMKFDNADAMDTDKNGDITTEELDAVMKARRDARRHGTGSGSGD